MKMWQKLFLGFLVVISIVAAAGYVSIQMSQEELKKSFGETSAKLASGRTMVATEVMPKRMNMVELRKMGNRVAWKSAIPDNGE
jgi:hypothetical protein